MIFIVLSSVDTIETPDVPSQTHLLYTYCPYVADVSEAPDSCVLSFQIESMPLHYVGQFHLGPARPRQMGYSIRERNQQYHDLNTAMGCPELGHTNPHQLQWIRVVSIRPHFNFIREERLVSNLWVVSVIVIQHESRQKISRIKLKFEVNAEVAHKLKKDELRLLSPSSYHCHINKHSHNHYCVTSIR